MAAQPGGSDGQIASLRERLRQDPDNDRGWFLLGMAYRESERFAEAAQAFRRAGELAPRNADYAAYRGEALLPRAATRRRPRPARLFRRALELQPGNPQARYYLATLKDMGGDHRGAVDDLVALLRESAGRRALGAAGARRGRPRSPGEQSYRPRRPPAAGARAAPDRRPPPPFPARRPNR